MSAITEEEAKKKWCPMARVFVAANEDHTGDVAAPNRNQGGHGIGGSECLASDCMMWRWRFRTTALRDEQHKTDKGYCGLAGSKDSL